MVVFEEGRPRSGEYRRFRVRTPEVAPGQPDDFASHREVLRRRFYRALEAEEGVGRGAALAPARPGRDRRRPGPGQRRARACSTHWGCTTCPPSAWPRSARRSSCPACRRRSSCRPTRRRCTCSSACATRRTASRSPITASCAPSPPTDSVLDEVRRSRAGAQARAAARLRLDAARCAARPSTRSRRCRASAARSPKRSTRPQRLISISLLYPAPNETHSFPSWSSHSVGLRRDRRSTSAPVHDRPFTPTRRTPMIDTRLGLDLQGGLRGEYQAIADGRPRRHARMTSKTIRRSSRTASTSTAWPSRSSRRRARTASWSRSRASPTSTGRAPADRLDRSARLRAHPQGHDRHQLRARSWARRCRPARPITTTSRAPCVLFSGDQIALGHCRLHPDHRSARGRLHPQGHGRRCSTFAELQSRPTVGNQFAIVLDGTVSVRAG